MVRALVREVMMRGGGGLEDWRRIAHIVDVDELPVADPPVRASQRQTQSQFAMAGSSFAPLPRVTSMYEMGSSSRSAAEQESAERLSHDREVPERLQARLDRASDSDSD